MTDLDSVEKAIEKQSWEEKYPVWDHEKFLASFSPAQRRNYDRYHKVMQFQFGLSKWFPWFSWPIIRVAYYYWSSVFEDGFGGGLGTLEFSFLNDGIKPSLWHTLYEVAGPLHGKYSAIWPSGAPKSKKHADELEARFAKEREERKHNA
jgi:hypothetical protein